MGWYSSNRTFEKALSFSRNLVLRDGVVLAVLQRAQCISQRLIPSNCCLYSMLYWCVHYRTCFGPLAQLARASGLHPEGHRFEPGRAHKTAGAGSDKLPATLLSAVRSTLVSPPRAPRRRPRQRRACRMRLRRAAPGRGGPPSAGWWSCAANAHPTGS